MNKIDKLKGKVVKIIFQKDNFYIMKVDIEDDDITILGNLDGIEEHKEYEFEGNYVDDEKYGLQFRAHYCRIILPTQKDLVISFLSGPDFVGIGKKTAENIYLAYAEYDDILPAILEDSSLLNNVKGLNDKKINNLLVQLKNHMSGDGLIEFLHTYQVEYDVVLNLFNRSGLDVDEFKHILLTNPFLLMKNGISYKAIIRIGNAFNNDNYSFLKDCGLVLSLIKDITFRNGATYLSKEQLKAIIDNKGFNNIDDNYYNGILKSLSEDRFIIIENDNIYEKDQYDAEHFISAYIKEYNNKKNNIDISNYLNEYENMYGITFNDKQKQAISNGINYSLSVITGGPGTGKSTIVDALINICKKINKDYSIALCAPTGKASKRLEQLTNMHANTIHRLLKWDMHSNTFGYDVLNPLDVDLLICDEFSMVDNLLMSALLKASINVKQIIFLGDYNQLPSVSQGKVLKDLVDSKMIETTFLIEIYRQKEGSHIIDLAYQVLNHEMINKNISNEEVNIIEANDNNISKILKEYKIKLVGNKDIQILAPMYKGNMGITKINNYIQYLLFNKFEGKYHVNDLVLQLKNRSDVEIYNGDIGKVVEVEKNKISVKYNEEIVEYNNTQAFEELTLSYCISIHKAQGNEYDEVIIFLPHYASKFVDNKILYTAITRAKKKLTIIADINTINNAILNYHSKNRQTLLKDKLIK
ncbi:MAG: AAA family ATPase [Bacilli bacterium]|jgi:exodeoxyribonuclease V alpha subunit|nr:AAA family ATPase [Bacilli bacterium]